MGDCHDHFGKWISHIAQLQLYHFWKIMQMGGLLERMFHNHKDFLAHDDKFFMSWFRLPTAILLELCAELGPTPEHLCQKRVNSCPFTGFDHSRFFGNQQLMALWCPLYGMAYL